MSVGVRKLRNLKKSAALLTNVRCSVSILTPVGTVQETLRYYPALATATTRIAHQDAMIGGQYFVPKVRLFIQ